MYCRNCGKQIDDNAVVCVHCGAATDNYTAPTGTEVKPKETNVLAIVGFILSFFVSIAGLICSIMGYRKAQQEGLDHAGLAKAGIIISAIGLAVGVIGMIYYFSVLGALLGSVRYY